MASLLPEVCTGDALPHHSTSVGKAWSALALVLRLRQGRQMIRLGLAAVVVAVLTASGAAHSGEPPSEPVLRIETGMHTAQIMRIGVDAAERFLVTASEDKTARVWDLETGRLLRVLRPPIGAGDEGKLFAVAISPDGAVVAAGGRTGWDWDGDHSVYLFDRQSGRLLRRLTGLPNVIYHLAFSRDGDHLAATTLARGRRRRLAHRRLVPRGHRRRLRQS